MSLTNRKEIIKLKSWAVSKEAKELFDEEYSVDSESFWKTREEENYIMQYYFQSIPEFENCCRKIIKNEMDQEIQRIVSVAIFKNKPLAKSKIMEELPEYRYTF